MAIIHISEAEASRDFGGLMARVRAGAEVLIEDGAVPVAVLHMPIPARRSIAECIALLPEDSSATIDEEFARDVQRRSRHIVNRSTLRYGADPRFQCADCGRAEGIDCAAGTP